jgi:hypothetical protein
MQIRTAPFRVQTCRSSSTLSGFRSDHHHGNVTFPKHAHTSPALFIATRTGSCLRRRQEYYIIPMYLIRKVSPLSVSGKFLLTKYIFSHISWDDNCHDKVHLKTLHKQAGQNIHNRHTLRIVLRHPTINKLRITSTFTHIYMIHMHG